MNKKINIVLVSLVVAEDVLLSSCTSAETHKLSESVDFSTAIVTSISSQTTDSVSSAAVSSTYNPTTQKTTQETTETTQAATTRATDAPTAVSVTEATTQSATDSATTAAAHESTTQAATVATTNAATAQPGSEFDTTSYAWYNIRNSTHTIPGIPGNAGPWLSAYNGIFVGDTSRKVFYFSFDAGYDTGYANQIMDVLYNQGIKATFFVTKSYIKNNPDIVRRMVNDGHAVANHTVSHSNLATLTDEEIRQEYKGVEDEFTLVTGASLTKCIRPPMGNYSERSLYVTSQLGYKTVFWSIAYKDYDTDNQPTYDEAMAIVQNNYHDGAIFLLHIASKTDADALNDMILFLKAQGYRFDVIG
ncbi:MAG: polysaccharide deacetylase family protein [Eubacteriales bacterium]